MNSKYHSIDFQSYNIFNGRFDLYFIEMSFQWAICVLFMPFNYTFHTTTTKKLLALWQMVIMAKFSDSMYVFQLKMYSIYLFGQYKIIFSNSKIKKGQWRKQFYFINVFFLQLLNGQFYGTDRKIKKKIINLRNVMISTELSTLG